jgi:hypothetical protein
MVQTEVSIQELTVKPLSEPRALPIKTVKVLGKASYLKKITAMSTATKN